MYEWHDAVEALKPRMVKITTPTGSGSGFLLSWESKSGLCAVATAAHVVDHAFYWEQPIRLDQIETGKSILIRQEQRAIFVNSQLDTAVIIVEAGIIEPPQGDLSLVPEAKYLRVGNEVGWLGFPSITPALCFFSGRISAWQENEKAYLIDGVAIHGVSGGVVFSLKPDAPMVVGVVSAYVPNRSTGEVLPGLAIARDVSYLHEQATTFASLDEARSAQSIPEPPVVQTSDVEASAVPTRS